MSNVFDQVTSALTGAVKSVTIDSELLPGPITIDLSGSKSDSNAGNFNVASILKPSVTVIDANGNDLYTSAPWGSPSDNRIPFFVATGALAVGLVVFVYGAYKLIKRA